MRTLSIIALSTALALSAAIPASAWGLGEVVDYVNSAKDGAKDKDCWKKMFTFRGCG